MKATQSPQQNQFVILSYPFYSMSLFSLFPLPLPFSPLPTAIAYLSAFAACQNTFNANCLWLHYTLHSTNSDRLSSVSISSFGLGCLVLMRNLLRARPVCTGQVPRQSFFIMAPDIKLISPCNDDDAPATAAVAAASAVAATSTAA